MKLERELWLEPLLAIIASVIIYQFNMLFFVFTVPLHMLALRKDLRSFLTAAGIVLAFILLQETVRNLGFGLSRQDILIVAIGLYGPIFLLFAAVWFHSLQAYMDRFYRFIGSWILPALTGFTLIMIYEGDSQTAIYTRELIEEQFSLLLQVGQEIGYGDVLNTFNPEFLYTFVLEVIKRGFLPSLVIQMGLCLYLGYQINAKIGKTEKVQVIRFKVPETILWPFLIAWTLVLMTSFLELGILGIIGWNIGLSLAVLYFLQGISIFIFQMRTKGVGMKNRSVVLWTIILLLLPGINILAMVGIPLFGISEIWIHYRDVNKEKLHENNS